MNIQYNVRGSERKALVSAISEILGRAAFYKGAPTFAYAVGNYLVDREGTLSCGNDVIHEEIKSLLAALKERGYLPGTVEMEDSADNNKLSIQMSKAGFTDVAIENLKKIIASKKGLIKKALGAETLLLEIGEEKIDFPWFTLNGVDGEVEAYAWLVTALCHMAKNQKRITAKEKEVENEKFTMRLFLIRLGCVGAAHKSVRRILLQNLSGNGSFKNGKPPEKAVESTSEENLTDIKNSNDENGGSTL